MTPGTHTSGPVSIATDRADYPPDGTIHVTVTNGLSVPIYASDHQASCSILRLERQVDNQWQPATDVARCLLGRPTVRVQIAAGASYTAEISAGSTLPNPITFPAGAYRLVLVYVTALDATAAPPTQPDADTTVASQTIQVS